MAINAKQRQKKLEKKNKKRKLAKKSSGSGIKLRDKALNFAKFPVHECLVPSALFETGIGNIIVARRAEGDSIAISAFVVDVFCLGLKDAFFKVSSEFDYEHRIKSRLFELHEDQTFEKVHLTCAKKLIDGAILYAKEIGFSPHRDYKNAKGIFGNVDGRVCPVKYIYGKRGKPFYIRGPNESPAQAKRIVAQLHKKCGDGNYRYLEVL